MLVLGRKEKQTVIIDGRIEVHVLGIRGGVVRLGFNAPTDVVIHRQEVQQRLDGRAASPQPVTLSARHLVGTLSVS